MLDQPLFLLFGAGAIIVISALFLRKTNQASTDKETVIHTSIDRTEMENTLKRFVTQVQKENDQTVTFMERNKQEVSVEIRQLSERVKYLETELAQLRSLIPNLQTNQMKPAEAKVETDVDSLLLKERFKRVFELKQQGLSIDEIAKRLGAGRGEIDLIFSLATPSQRGSVHDET